MASHALSGLTGTQENGQRGQGPENSIHAGMSMGQQQNAGSSPSKQGLCIQYDGPRSHTDLLEFYFGHPTSTAKDSGAPSLSRW